MSTSYCDWMNIFFLIKEPYLFESEVVALGKAPLRKSPTNFSATETRTLDSRHRTMAALRRAGLIPPDDYTGVISSFGVHHTQYADDTQLYIELRDNAVTSLDNCFRAVHQCS